MRGGKGQVRLPLARKFSGMKVGIWVSAAWGAPSRRVPPLRLPDRLHGPKAIDGVPYTFVASLHGLASQSDALLSPRRRIRLKGSSMRAVLDALGPDGYLINVARGKLVNEADLVQALAAKRIAGAGLDVFVDEPNVPGRIARGEERRACSRTVRVRPCRRAPRWGSRACEPCGELRWTCRPETSVTP